MLSLFAIYAVLKQHPFCRILRTFVWSKTLPKNLVCGAKMTNIMYARPRWTLSAIILNPLSLTQSLLGVKLSGKYIREFPKQ